MMKECYVIMSTEMEVDCVWLNNKKAEDYIEFCGRDDLFIIESELNFSKNDLDVIDCDLEEVGEDLD